MSGFSVFALASGLLQLSIPSYSLRLVRRFGTQRVGWFIVAAFSCLALLYLLKPIPAMNTGPKGILDLIYSVAALFLVIGLGHIETLCSQRQRSDSEERRLRAQWEAESREKTADLEATNERLIKEIARRENAEILLKESEAQYRHLFSENPQPMWIFDLRSLRPLAVNESALRQYGYSEREFMALAASDFASPSMVTGFLQDVAKPCSEAQYRGVWEHRRKDQSALHVEITAVDLRYSGYLARLMVATDISNRQQREQERCDAQQRQLAGRLAGGVAHHFNNILSIINGHASLLQESAPDKKTGEHLNQICLAVDRAATLSRQLLMVSGQHLHQADPLELNGLIQQLEPMLRRIVGDKASVRFSLDPIVPSVFADARALEHVLVNLVLNARDAINTAGVISVTTSKVRLQNIPLAHREHARPGNFVCLAIRDNGCGMTPEVQARVFEPFFTTRDVQKGAGLGLASSAGAIRELSGWIEFDSQPEAGSEFRVLLPCATTWQKDNPTTSTAPSLSKETILLVEPDDRLRSVTRTVLNRRGYHVIETDCAEIALALWEGQGNQVGLLFTETMLPGETSGLDLAAQLLSKKPDLRVLYTSNSDQSKAAADFLPKPYIPENLLGAISNTFTAPAAA